MCQTETYDQIIRRFEPDFRYRWEVYDDLLKSHLSHNKTWLDLGCGSNEYVRTMGSRAGTAYGVDILPPKSDDKAFIRADMRSLPFPSGFADLITIRFVVEHLKKIPHDLNEAIRVLKSGGHLMIFTSNRHNPIVFLSRLLPHKLKSNIIQNIYKVKPDDILPAYHQLNSPGRLRKGFDQCRLEKLLFVENITTINALMFYPSLIWYLLTKLKLLNYFRSNLLAVYQKL